MYEVPQVTRVDGLEVGVYRTWAEDVRMRETSDELGLLDEPADKEE